MSSSMTDLGSFYGDNWLLVSLNCVGVALLVYAVTSFSFNRRLDEMSSDIEAAWDEYDDDTPWADEYEYQQPTAVIPVTTGSSYYEAGTGAYAALAALDRPISPAEVLMPLRAPYVEAWEDRTRVTGIQYSSYAPQVPVAPPAYRPTVPIVPGSRAPRHRAPESDSQDRVWRVDLLTSTQEWSRGDLEQLLQRELVSR